jgi:sugar lactone lactonase YvrE
MAVADAEFRVLLGDRVLVESPRWHDDRLLFSDWGAQEIVGVDLTGRAEVVAEVHAMPFCLDRLPDGSLLVVANSQLLQQQADGVLLPYADLSTVSTKPWNDIVVDGRGNIYVNNIGFDFGQAEYAPGLIAHVGSDGTVRQVADDRAFPNGMAVTQDGSTLIVAESYAGRLTAYNIEPDGGLSHQRIWADLGEGSAPDGICVDSEDAVWFASVPGQRCVRVREGGEVLQTIEADRGCFACMLGGPDGRSLFAVVAAWPEAMGGAVRTGQVLVADVSVPGAGWPR